MCLQVFRKKRTFSDFENVIGVMLQCEECFDEGWRKAEGSCAHQMRRWKDKIEKETTVHGLETKH